MALKHTLKSPLNLHCELLDKGLLYWKTSSNIYLEDKDALKILDETLEFSAPDQRALIALDIGTITGASMGFRHKFATTAIKNHQLACALIVKNQPSYLVGSFMMGLNRPTFPVKIFFNPNEAFKWLQLFRR